MKYIIVAMIGFGVSACDEKLPIKSYLCSAGAMDVNDESCFLHARFDNMDSCEEYKKLGSMYCTTSDTGVMNCSSVSPHGITSSSARCFCSH